MDNKNMAITFSYANIKRYERKDATRPVGKGDVIFCDFDGTITEEDVVDKLLTLYADEFWKKIEKQWQQRKIGSEACLRMQLKCIESIKESELLRFAFDIKIDPSFPKFLSFVRKRGIDFYIVSDGFDWLIRIILLNNGISNLPVFANRLKIKNREPVPSFPFKVRECYMRSGMCKCSIINQHTEGRNVTYIGDGESDICAVRKADNVFAKNRLSDYCRLNAIDFIEFSSFDDITNALFNRERMNADR
jgi:2-hydroxy-3-keto-5-methylthiopentenyl-1-phosphate phosphatase